MVKTIHDDDIIASSVLVCLANSGTEPTVPINFIFGSHDNSYLNIIIIRTILKSLARNAGWKPCTVDETPSPQFI